MSNGCERCINHYRPFLLYIIPFIIHCASLKISFIHSFPSNWRCFCGVLLYFIALIVCVCPSFIYHLLFIPMDRMGHGCYRTICDWLINKRNEYITITCYGGCQCYIESLYHMNHSFIPMRTCASRYQPHLLCWSLHLYRSMYAMVMIFDDTNGIDNYPLATHFPPNPCVALFTSFIHSFTLWCHQFCTC